jgi:hypothetical protein
MATEPLNPPDVIACGAPTNVKLCDACIDAYRNGIEPGESACEDRARGLFWTGSSRPHGAAVETDDHAFLVVVKGCTALEAERVMVERIGPDEDYGFDYTIDWSNLKWLIATS